MEHRSDGLEEVIEGHQKSDREIAKMISRVPIEIVRVQRCVCGLGAALHFVGLPQFNPFEANKAVAFLISFGVIYFFAKFLELGIIFGGSFFRSSEKGFKKFLAILNGLIVIVLSAGPSVVLSGLLFESIVEMMHKNDLMSVITAYALGTMMPVMQTLMQIYKAHREKLVKESTNASDLQQHLFNKRTETMIIEERMNAVERIVKDKNNIDLIDSATTQDVIRHIRSLFEEKNTVEGNLIDAKTKQPLLLPSAQAQTQKPTTQAKTADTTESSQEKPQRNTDRLQSDGNSVSKLQRMPTSTIEEDRVSSKTNSEVLITEQSPSEIITETLPDDTQMTEEYSLGYRLIGNSFEAKSDTEMYSDDQEDQEDQEDQDVQDVQDVQDDHVENETEVVVEPQRIEQPNIVQFRQKQQRPKQKAEDDSQPKTKQVIAYIEALDKVVLLSFLDRKNRAERKKVADHFGITERTLMGILKPYKDKMEAAK